MILKTKKFVKHTPFRTVALLLFAAVISAVVCGLHASNEAYLCEQEEALQSTPITVTVRGVPVYEGHKAAISPWTIDLFTGKNPVEIQDMSSENREITLISLSEYLKEVQVKMSDRINGINGLPVYRQGSSQYPDLIGISSLSCDEQLLPEKGCEITWYNGYNESIFGGGELVCLVPEGKLEAYDNGNGGTALYFYVAMGKLENGTYVEVSRTEYECTLKIVGTYTAGDEVSIYCPLSIMEQVYAGLDEMLSPNFVSATLVDNQLLDEFREKASFFYSNLSENAPNVSNEIRVLNRSKAFTFDSNHNALEINDSKLIDFMSDLEAHSTKFNRIVTLAIVAFSVAAGFLIGFLTIRLRKSDIILTRPDGKSLSKKYLGFVLEQFICIILGITAGGACYLWNPIDKLLIFAVVYFVAFSVAALLFLIVQGKRDQKIPDFNH